MKQVSGFLKSGFFFKADNWRKYDLLNPIRQQNLFR